MQIRTTNLAGLALMYAVDQHLEAATVLELLAQRITKLERTPDNKFRASCKAPLPYEASNPFAPTYEALGHTFTEAVFRACLRAKVGDFTEVPNGALAPYIARRGET